MCLWYVFISHNSCQAWTKNPCVWDYIHSDGLSSMKGSTGTSQQGPKCDPSLSALTCIIRQTWERSWAVGQPQSSSKVRMGGALWPTAEHDRLQKSLKFFILGEFSKVISDSRQLSDEEAPVWRAVCNVGLDGLTIKTYCVHTDMLM